MNKTIEEIVNQIENRVNTYTNEKDINTYHVNIKTGKDCVSVTPKSGNTLFCIDRLVKVADFYTNGNYYVTVKNSKPTFRIFSIK